MQFAGDDDDDDDDDSEDEEAALLAELAKIKREREAEREAQAAKQVEADLARRKEEARHGNALVSLGGTDDDAGPGGGGGGGLKRKWYEDTVFRNQARDEPRPTKRFINDTVRSDFHRKFLDRYLR